MERHAAVLARADQRLQVLRKARPAVARPREQERRSDAAVRPDPLADEGHIRTDGVTQQRDLVHERDARRQHGVRRVLGHFGRRQIHEDDGIAGPDERRIELGHHVRRLGRIHTDDDSVRLHEVFDRGALLQELGVRADVKCGRRVLGDFRADPFRGPDRNGALGDDQLGAIHVLADGARHVQHVLQVRRAVLSRRRSHGNENDIRALDRAAEVGRELQAAVALVPHDERLEPGLVDRQPVLAQAVDLGLVDVDAQDIIARFGEARPCHETDVPRAEHRDLHGSSRCRRTAARAFRVSTTTRAHRSTRT